MRVVGADCTTEAVTAIATRLNKIDEGDSFVIVLLLLLIVLLLVVVVVVVVMIN